MNRDPFKEYIKQSEPDRRSRGYAWHTAIGLQAVDGLKPSKYLIDTAIQNIEGNITIKEAQEIIDSYYEAKPRAFDEDRTEEADKVSARIAGLLTEKAFSFSSNEYIGIHRKLFQGIYNHAGKIRDYNITKKEWVLDGATVLYGSASELRATLEYDLELEKNFSYKGLSMDDIIRHLAVFISRLWQIHIFGEGNTRATAVFFIKYLRNLGFDATNDIFAENAWYFRNSLVRANYNNLKEGIYETTEYLETFLRNLLLDEQNELSNRKLHIYVKSANQKPDIRRQNPDIDGQNPDIEASKATIDIPEQFQMILESFSKRTISHVQKLYENYGSQTVFGRSDVVELLGIQKSSSSELLKKMLQSGIIVKVSGYGKGKYRFTGI
ncbi:Fic family protein [Lachnospiraceae bacterium ASD3451]|uniref:Fic family protein n=1 Tax=Diplocloster agilis TaxID=2850323 RepID=UPI001E07A767|nr:Fic family protein [Diplocloster agilis]MBU9747187.1 Fic family protein [Diplocloster agilis]